MAHIIAEPCIGTKDTACVEVCPVDCIHPTTDESTNAEGEQLFIDPDTCIDCGLYVDECPVQAIFPEEDLPEEWTKYIQINATGTRTTAEDRPPRQPGPERPPRSPHWRPRGALFPPTNQERSSVSPPCGIAAERRSPRRGRDDRARRSVQSSTFDPRLSSLLEVLR